MLLGLAAPFNGPGPPDQETSRNPGVGRAFNAREISILTHDQVAILRDISQSIAFADDRHGEVEQLIIEGYVMKAGDLYELTSKGLRAVENHPTESDAS